MGKYYSLQRIKEKKARYNLIYGERSNGKTFSVLEEGLKIVIKSDYTKQFCIIRRWEEDFKGKNGEQQFEGFINNKEKGNILEKMTNGKYNYIKYQSKRWYLAKKTIDVDGKECFEINKTPFCYAFGIASEEHYKSLSFPNIVLVLLDEYITRRYYLNDEFILFTSLLSTIIRDRDDVIIYMCGNSINKYCVYHIEMGLHNVNKMKKGDIDVYKYGDSGLVVAIEYSDSPSKKKKSNVYFAFNNPKLKMITDGEWEIDIYPHLPTKYRPKDVILHYYIVFNNEKLECKIIKVDDMLFTYIHRKTTDIKDDNKRFVYQQDYDVKENYRRNITKCFTNIEKFIYSFYVKDKVFYQDNEVGEIVRNYLMWCTHGN